MPILAFIRDSFIGQIAYRSSGHRLLCYPEDERDFVLPERYATLLRHSSFASETATTGDRTYIEAAAVDPGGPTSKRAPERPESWRNSTATAVADPSRYSDPLNPEKGRPEVVQKEAEQSNDPYLVDWYGPDDPECPRTWSFAKRCFVTFNICLLTVSIYIGSAIYAPGVQDVAQKFGVSTVAATLGITMFVVGYGIGPMFLSPLSEIPQFGRTSVYIISLFIFVLLQIPTALSTNLGALLPLRFLAGFVGSPALATGGASLVDMWTDEWRAVLIGFWGIAGVSGPVLGPTIGGFAVQAEGWTWTIWILMWLSGSSLCYLTIFLPETSSQAILYRRAVRLRRVTGNPRFKCQWEIDAEHMSMGEVAKMTLVRPFLLGFTEPIVAFWNLYIALLYGILYCFISSFDVVFVEKHHFNLGENGLAFLGLIVGAIVAFIPFIVYVVVALRPKFVRGTYVPEDRLPAAMFGGTLLPISMFWFGWTSAASIHWISPILASGLFCSSAFLLFQAGLNYLPDCYPRYVASILAGNDFFRSMVGAAFPVFSTAFFHNLGVGPACSVLGGVAVLMMPIPFLLYRYGAKIRSWSKYAD